MTLKNPFEVGRERLATYLLFSFLTPMVAAGVFWSWSDQLCPSIYYKINWEYVADELGSKFNLDMNSWCQIKQEDLRYQHPTLLSSARVRYLYNYCMALSMQCLMIIGIFSLIFSCRRLYKPGISNQMRSLFWKKHFFYVIVLIIIQLNMLLSNFYELYNPLGS